MENTPIWTRELEALLFLSGNETVFKNAIHNCVFEKNKLIIMYNEWVQGLNYGYRSYSYDYRNLISFMQCIYDKCEYIMPDEIPPIPEEIEWEGIKWYVK